MLEPTLEFQSIGSRSLTSNEGWQQRGSYLLDEALEDCPGSHEPAPAAVGLLRNRTGVCACGRRKNAKARTCVGCRYGRTARASTERNGTDA
jgi:hypothetical protein